MATLTDKQERFIHALMLDPEENYTNATIKAGYSVKTAKSIASQLMAKPHIVAELNRRKTDRASRMQVDADYVVQELLKAVKVATGELPTITSTKTNGKTKNAAIYKTNLAALNKSLELLGRHVGMFTDKQELNVSGSLEQTISDISKQNANERISLLPKDNLDFGDE